MFSFKNQVYQQICAVRFYFLYAVSNGHKKAHYGNMYCVSLKLKSSWNNFAEL